MTAYLIPTTLALALAATPVPADTIITASGSGWCTTSVGFFCNNTSPAVIANTYTDRWFANWFAFQIPAEVAPATTITLNIWNASSMWDWNPDAFYILQTFQGPPTSYPFFSNPSPQIGSITLGDANTAYLVDGGPFFTSHFVTIPITLPLPLSGTLFLTGQLYGGPTNVQAFGGTDGNPVAFLTLNLAPTPTTGSDPLAFLLALAIIILYVRRPLPKLTLD